MPKKSYTKINKRSSDVVEKQAMDSPVKHAGSPSNGEAFEFPLTKKRKCSNDQEEGGKSTQMVSLESVAGNEMTESPESNKKQSGRKKHKKPERKGSQRKLGFQSDLCKKEGVTRGSAGQSTCEYSDVRVLPKQDDARDIPEQADRRKLTQTVITHAKDQKGQNQGSKSSAISNKKSKQQKVTQDGESHRKNLDSCVVVVRFNEDKNIAAGSKPIDQAKPCETGSCKSEESSDDDLMEGPLSSPSKVSLELNDVVWAKLGREPFWPAQIKRVQGKKSNCKRYVKFIGYSSQTYIAVRQLEPFSTDKREQFIEEGEKFCREKFKKALIDAEDIVRKKDYQLVDFQDVSNTLIPDMSHFSAETMKNDEEGDTTPRKSSRQRKQVCQYSLDILPYIRQSKPILRQIFEGKKYSERHDIFRNGSQKQRDKLKRRSGFGPVTDDDVQHDIMEMLREFYQELDDNRFAETSYVSDVMLPEAMIAAIHFRDGLSLMRAEEMYMSL
ncbi:uncharacterized protein LOC5517775 isoform X2 [Nematostella vectensis]|uniref:uncharacterized protein LOC5517775 isoform X2 n=1 Tax=Nematostella vectensis TaxID=45351 RepID=UPI00207702A8|nr:uncharacterized protein LOC5517775 isoform X2 [Nematostella vectensis]